MKKVAVVNRTTLLNFGSVLQVLALAKAAETFGYEVDVIWEEGSLTKNIDLRPRKLISLGFKLLGHPQFIVNTIRDFRAVKKIEYTENTKVLFANFVKKNIKRRFFPHDQMSVIGHGDEYYKFICGSDQIWSSTTLYPDPLMYLRFVPDAKRVAYAPSFGRNYIPSYNKKILRKYISEIPAVSVRELEGASLINDLIGRDVPVVLDPTLLFDTQFWGQYQESIVEKDFILSYFLNEPSESVQQEIIKFANGRKIIALKSPHKYITDNYNSLISPEIGPGEFLSYVEMSDFIFTDSYHGMIFSINFEKEFLSVERKYGKYDQSTRQRSILKQLEITDHYNNSGTPSKNTIDYKTVTARLRKLREYSYNYLKIALNNE